MRGHGRGTGASGLQRHADRVVSELIAEYGRADCIRRRWPCDPDTYDRLRETYGSVGVVGGAGALVIDADGRALLVRYEGEEAWSDPGTGRRPGESMAECATRAVSRATDVTCRVTGLAQIHLLYAADDTRRTSVPRPFALFAAEREAGEPRPVGDGVEEARWWSTLPEELRYEELRELC
ncbi:MAG: NUDIX domain-containing protein [Haloarculaceae archaeon]